ncbi:MAG: hypothetical protein ACR2NU_05075, partial [Aeoliella sp.]
VAIATQMVDFVDTLLPSATRIGSHRDWLRRLGRYGADVTGEDGAAHQQQSERTPACAPRVAVPNPATP